MSIDSFPTNNTHLNMITGEKESAGQKNKFSVMSYNILLPNSDDGWWTYKNYLPITPFELRTWEYRKSLLKSTILRQVML